MDGDNRHLHIPGADAFVSSQGDRATIGRRGCFADWRKRKGQHKQYGCYLGVSIFHVTEFPFIVLAFRDLSSLRTHFRPFTEVMRKGWREVTAKVEFRSFVSLFCPALRYALAISRLPILQRAQAREGEAEKLRLSFRYLDGS